MRAFEKLATRRFNEGVLAEEAVTYVVEGLSADEWARCRAFRGTSKPSTFLYSLASNLIEEFSRQRFGRPRPPSWLQAQGETWVRMWKMLCLERQLLPSILDKLSGTMESGLLTDIARTIKARMPNCGVSAMDHESMEDVTSISDAQQDGDGVANAAESAEVAEVILLLRSVVDDEPAEDHFSEDARASAAGCAAENSSAFVRLREQLALSDDEKLLLKMIFVEGFSKSAASRALGLLPHQAGRIANSALQRIGDALRNCGLSLDDLVDKL